MTDQHRWDAVGCMGNPAIQTPNIDSLAHSGTLFANPCTTTPLCVPARMSFITGRRLSRTRWIKNAMPQGGAPELPTVMTMLRQQGYWNQGIGKMHFFGRHFGFCNLVSQEECVDHWIDDDYTRYLRREGVWTRFPLGILDRTTPSLRSLRAVRFALLTGEYGAAVQYRTASFDTALPSLEAEGPSG